MSDGRLLMLVTARCVASFHIPNATYCPPDLKAIGQLANFYKQITLEHTVRFLLCCFLFSRQVWLFQAVQQMAARSITITKGAIAI